jgi:hypothetical protein
MRVVWLSMIALLTVVVSSCNDVNCRWNESDADLQEKYRSLDLASLYKLHIDYSSRCTPPRTSLAPLIAERGTQARSYAISHIENGNYRSLEAAISVTAYVTSNYNLDCSISERQRLLSFARSLRASNKSISIINRSIINSCSAKSLNAPINIKEYGG